MSPLELKAKMEISPVIAAIRENNFSSALKSPAEVLFLLDPHLITIADLINQAHKVGKSIFVHMDLAEGIGKDKEGLQYLARCGLDGVISTRGQIIRMARDLGLLTVQRFFALDSQGMGSIQELLRGTGPHFLEIMPGVISKVIERLSTGSIPVIAGGLIETKQEITAALCSGALAVSTGTEKLWYV